MLGPVSLLLLAKGVPEPLSLLLALSIVYANTLELLCAGTLLEVCLATYFEGVLWLRHSRRRPSPYRPALSDSALRSNEQCWLLLGAETSRGGGRQER